MAENFKVYNLESFTDEERERVEALINQIEEEKKNEKKWWIIPKYNYFEKNEMFEHDAYSIEIQEYSYSKCKVPLKSDFNSREEAEKWLKNYLEEESLFKSAIDDVDKIVQYLDYIIQKLQKHEYITKYDWDNCFRLYNESRIHGALYKVTKGVNNL